MHSIRNAVALFATLALLPLAAACGPSCETVCEKRIQCQSKASLGIASEKLSSCVSSCEAGFCGGDEEATSLANECYAAMTCSSMTGAAAELVSCADRCN